LNNQDFKIPGRTFYILNHKLKDIERNVNRGNYKIQNSGKPSKSFQKEHIMRKNATVITILFSLLFFASLDQGRDWDWAVKFFGDKNDIGYDLVIDQQNNYYITGFFYDDITIGDSKL
jgi:hypothetical protein